MYTLFFDECTMAYMKCQNHFWFIPMSWYMMVLRHPWQIVCSCDIHIYNASSIDFCDIYYMFDSCFFVTNLSINVANKWHLSGTDSCKIYPWYYLIKSGVNGSLIERPANLSYHLSLNFILHTFSLSVTEVKTNNHWFLHPYNHRDIPQD